ncbi:hypothetical protein GOBAR_DD30035 [Gossypium barbadense]|nr:hypothetical protein GOBAR_DD30035 [Gossypium barbadense]
MGSCWTDPLVKVCARTLSKAARCTGDSTERLNAEFEEGQVTMFRTVVVDRLAAVVGIDGLLRKYSHHGDGQPHIVYCNRNKTPTGLVSTTHYQCNQSKGSLAVGSYRRIHGEKDVGCLLI